MAGPVDHPGDVEVFALEDSLDRAVAAVAHPACDAGHQRLTLGCVAEEDPLHPPVNDHPLPGHDASAVSARNSYATFAPSSAVTWPALSYGGETSTTSKPLKRSPASERMKASASCGKRPATSGVPVPGANAGSSTSMSKLKNAGPSPTRSRTRRPYSSGDSDRRSSPRTISNPISRASPRSDAA